jgi:signal transduction histidine kinase
MKRKIPDFPLRYQKLLKSFLSDGGEMNPNTAEELGTHAHSCGLKTLDLFKLHDRIVVADILPECPRGRQATLSRRASLFFSAVIAAGESPQDSSTETLRLKKVIRDLSRQMVDLSGSNHHLSLDISRIKASETSLKKSGDHQAEALNQSNLLKKQLRGLSREMMSVHEDERKKISRELHDVIAQTLIGINIQLASLKKEAGLNNKGLGNRIAITQRLIIKSANIVNQFACELHPSVLDDLGLIAALNSFMKIFKAKTGVHTRLTAFAGIEKIEPNQRILLYRIIEEALTNIGLHAHAGFVDIELKRSGKSIRLTIEDDGASFLHPSGMSASDDRQSGMLGLRERLEMAGSSFRVNSAKGKGTIVTALIPGGKIPIMK